MIRPAVLLIALAGCTADDLTVPVQSDEVVEAPSAQSMHGRVYRTSDGLMELYFTNPGTQPGEEEDPLLDDAVIELIDDATSTIDASLYEFGRQPVVDAMVAAHQRGVTIRFAGDGDEVHDPGYEALDAEGLRLALRKPYDRIMHNKFLVVDDQYVWTGSANFSENGVMFNNNGAVLVDDPTLAAIYTQELDQMYEHELFGRKKGDIDTGGTHDIGTHSVDLWFSPQHDTHQALLQQLSTADHTVFFMIFSFTRDDIADELIALHESGVQVVGVFDESQGRGRYSVDEKLAAAGVPVFIDGNENSYGFAGGKLHHKVMLVDALTASDPAVSIGSYNWSQSASEYNDENLTIVRGPEITAAYFDEFCSVLNVAVPHPDYTGEIPEPCAALLQEVRINEFLPNPDGTDRGNEFVEIVNTGLAAVDLTGWQLGDGYYDQRHVFGDKVLAPGDALVVFDGPGHATPFTVEASSGYLGLNNGGDEIVLRDEQDSVIDRVSYVGSESGRSFNRDPDGAKEGDFVLHADPDGDGLATSPGTREDGTLWGGEVLINEVLPDPACDGCSDADDEWIEIVNVGQTPVDLAGWSLYDERDDSAVFTFPATATIINPNQSFLVLADDNNDGTGLAAEPAFDDAFVAGTSLSLNNSDGGVTLRDDNGFLRDDVAWASSTPDVSLNRADDGDRDAPLVDHATLDPGDDLAPLASSPGKRFDGSPWGARLLVNEIFPNPAGTDAGHEFVEIVNAGTADADLRGWMLGDAVDPARHVFEDRILTPGDALVIWDAGEHPGDLVASTGFLSLNNAGDLVSLHAPDGSLHDAVTYNTSSEGVSLNRAVDGDPDSPVVDHDTLDDVTAGSSPGTRADGSPWGAQLVINELLPNPTGTDNGNEFIEIVNTDPDNDASLLDWAVGDAIDPQRHVFGDVTLAPGEALLLWDGEVPDHAPTIDGLQQRPASSGDISLNNTGDTITLYDATGATHDVVTYGGSTEGVSLNRSTDADPESPLVDHDTISSSADSPGTRVDGAAW